MRERWVRTVSEWRSPGEEAATYSAPILRCIAKAFQAHRSDRALWNTAPRSLPERMPREQCAMTACLEWAAKSLSFAVRSRGAEVATKKVNVFAEWESGLRAWQGGNSLERLC